MTFPITERPEWSIRDSSKLTDFDSCARQYFYKHILGWVPEFPNHDLHFGECWHRAREYQLLNGYDQYLDAYMVFLEHYRTAYSPETDSIYTHKSPTGVLNALKKFHDDRSLDLVENEVVVLDGKKMTEISGTVPVDRERVLHYRMDSIMRRKSDGMIFSWDHKTTHEKYINGNQWAESFFLGIQNGTYTHCLYCMFPVDQVLGVEFCGTGFTHLKRGSAARPAGYHATLRRVPAFKSPDQMNVWLWNTLAIMDDLDEEMERLFDCKESDPVLMAFPMRPKSCTDYRGCAYHDYCLSWGNPLRQCYEPPLGFKEEFWDPSAKESTVKKDLEWGGN